MAMGTGQQRTVMVNRSELRERLDPRERYTGEKVNADQMAGLMSSADQLLKVLTKSGTE
jgi:hypothetical protein